MIRESVEFFADIKQQDLGESVRFIIKLFKDENFYLQQI